MLARHLEERCEEEDAEMTTMDDAEESVQLQGIRDAANGYVDALRWFMAFGVIYSWRKRRRDKLNAVRRLIDAVDAARESNHLSR